MPIDFGTVNPTARGSGGGASDSGQGGNDVMGNYSWSVDRSYSVGYRAMQEQREKRSRRRKILGGILAVAGIVVYLILRIV